MNKVMNYINEQFSKYESNTEVSDLKEEIILNCEERYKDNISSGMSEEEAESDVIAHIGDLSDVLNEISTKESQSTKEVVNDSYTTIQSINISVISADIKFVKSNSDTIDVFATKEIYQSVENGCLIIKQIKKENNGSFLRRILNAQYYSNLAIEIAIPDAFEEITLNSTSGDVTFDDVSILHPIINTTSGDIKGRITSTEQARFNSVSGNIEISIVENSSKLECMTISGDQNISVLNTKRIHLESTSGDITFDPQSDFLKSEIESVSGDVCVYTNNLSEGNFSVKSVFGDTFNSTHLNPSPAKNNLFVKTLSGDIKFH